MRDFIFTSESVTEGHPDKMADQISDSVLDAVLAQDPTGRVACETFLTTGLVVVGGEITTTAQIDVPSLVRATVNDIGFTNSAFGFDGSTCAVLVVLDEQSPDIAQGVDREGAGDQGLMFGYACRETPELMPLPITLAHRLAHRLAEVRKDGTLPGIRPDGKSQVAVRYSEEGGYLVPVEVTQLLISTQHTPGYDQVRLRRDLIEHVFDPVIPEELRGGRDLHEETYVHVNPTGKFELGGPMGDAGLTGRKIIVDTYGGMARHGGGAFSGKDPTKVDRSAAYAARWVAKNVVAADLADRCEVQISYAIGVAHPFSVMIECFETEKVDIHQIEAAVDEVFDLRPVKIVEALQLRRPVFRQTAAYGHFGRSGDGFTWERTDRAEALRSVIGLAATVA